MATGCRGVQRIACDRYSRRSERLAGGGLEVTVDSDGRARARSDGAGFGLVGMRERVALYGGELEAGPTAGGFRVHAELPFREGAPA
jgi:glucose-6-phosphate-specific signal transduction histidine kinase